MSWRALATLSAWRIADSPSSAWPSCSSNSSLCVTAMNSILRRLCPGARGGRLIRNRASLRRQRCQGSLLIYQRAGANRLPGPNFRTSVDKSHSATLSEVTECEELRAVADGEPGSRCEVAHRTAADGARGRRRDPRFPADQADAPGISREPHDPQRLVHASVTRIANCSRQSSGALEHHPPGARADRAASASADRRQHGWTRGLASRSAGAGNPRPAPAYFFPWLLQPHWRAAHPMRYRPRFAEGMNVHAHLTPGSAWPWPLPRCWPDRPSPGTTAGSPRSGA